jgi:hypothetical protein
VNAVNYTDIKADLTEDDSMLACDVSDEALEATAGTCCYWLSLKLRMYAMMLSASSSLMIRFGIEL